MTLRRAARAHAALPLTVLGAAAILGACYITNGEATDTLNGALAAGSSGTGGLPCDVSAALAAKCQGCHAAQPLYGAPMPLVGFGNLIAPAKSNGSKSVYELVETRTHDATNPMPPPGHPTLTTSEQQALDQWIAQGAPRSGDACATTAAPTSQVESLTCPAGTTLQHVRPHSAATIASTETDKYVCYTVDAASLRAAGDSGKHHVVGFGAVIGNPRIVHHTILFQAPDSTDATSLPYGPDPTTCDQGAVATLRFVAGWTPGTKPFLMPPAAGFPQTGATRYVVQVHLNNQQALTDQTDETGFDVCATGSDNLRPNDADVVATGGIHFTIPPHSTTTLTGDYTWGKTNVTMVAVAAHMHKLGSAFSLSQTAGGATKKLFENDVFSFQNQGGSTELDQPLATGDKLTTTCTWKNTTDAPVSFGEKTSNEMCFGFIIYYPKQSFPSFAVPAALSKLSLATSGL